MSMLGVMELGHKLATVRPLHEKPSEFDEAAFQHIRQNFRRLLSYFNELSDLTGQDALQIENNSALPAQAGIAPSVNSLNGKS